MFYGFQTEYARQTVSFKKAYGSGIGAITDRITLYMFGDFYDRMFTVVKGETFTVKSSVPYFEKIVQRSGPDVMKLTPDSMNILLEYFINPIVKETIEEALYV